MPTLENDSNSVSVNANADANANANANVTEASAKVDKGEKAPKSAVAKPVPKAIRMGRDTMLHISPPSMFSKDMRVGVLLRKDAVVDDAVVIKECIAANAKFEVIG